METPGYDIVHTWKSKLGPAGFSNAPRWSRYSIIQELGLKSHTGDAL